MQRLLSDWTDGLFTLYQQPYHAAGSLSDIKGIGPAAVE